MVLKTSKSEAKMVGYIYTYPGPPTYPTIITSQKNVNVTVSSTNDPTRKGWNPWGYTTGITGSGFKEEWGLNYLSNGQFWSRFSYKQLGEYWLNVEAYTSPPIIAEANNIVTVKMLSRLSEARNQWNFAVSLGEARETSAHMLHTARRLVHAYRSIRRNDYVGAWRTLVGAKPGHSKPRKHFKDIVLRHGSKDAANVWMEIQYGWLPLLGDIDNAAQYLARKHVEKVQQTYKFRTSQEVKQEGVYLVPNFEQTAEWQDQIKWTNFANAGLSFELRPKFLREPSTLEELGFTDPYSLVWELLPLSFVTDWFVNVGQVLQSLHEFNQWEVIRGIRSERSGYVRRLNPVTNRKGPYVELGLSSFLFRNWPSYNLVSTIHRRTPEAALPTAVPLRIKVSNPFDLKSGQFASALALLRQTFR